MCETDTNVGKISLCSYGVNYVRVDNDLLVAGVVARDYPDPTPAWRKQRAHAGTQAVDMRDLYQVLAKCQVSLEEQAAELRQRKDEVIAEYRDSKGYQSEVVEQLRPELEHSISQAHDYKQFVQHIIQNMNVILEARFPGLSIEDKLDQAIQEEAAVYWAALLMNDKLDAALYLDDPERIHEPREQGRFRLHGLVLKYVRIYQSRASLKNVNIRVSGESWAKIEGNSRALGIVPHAMLDNALKYAPARSSVRVIFDERGDKLTFVVESFGPRIEPDELPRIFDLFFRAEAAKRMSSEGTGFGLASAQQIAKAHNTEIRVEQADKRRDDTYKTTFSVTFPIAEREMPA
jgi:signal transduction histidine kinase